MKLKKITLSNDLDDLPPPYCYRYQLEIELSAEAVVNFSVEYYGREDLDPDEIEAEGFSENDDFQWKGTLPEHWREEIINQVSALAEGRNKKGVKISTLENGEPREMKPASNKDFEYFTQELIQAIYEISGRQNSLLIKAMYNAPGRLAEQYDLSVSFHKRKAALTGRDKSKNGVEWRRAQKALEKLFQYDLDPISEKTPKNEGLFIDLGEGFWYRVLPGKSGKDSKKLHEEVIGLFQELTRW